MSYDLHRSVFGSYRFNRMFLHPVRNALGKPIGKCHDIGFASVILNKFVPCSPVFVNQALHISRIRTSEFINVLIVIPYRNDPHIIIVLHQGTDQSKFICIHILRFINDKNAFCNLSLLHLAVCNHLSGIAYYIFHAVKTSDLPK